MKFAIQTSNPKPTRMVSSSDATLGEAIETMFPLLTEFAIIIWNNVYVPITYKYDVSIIINDVIEMVTAIGDRETGLMTIDWPSNTFQARWALTWTANNVTINSSWGSVIGGTEALLNAASTLTIEKEAFLAEWGNLLRMLNALILKFSDGIKVEFDLSVLNRVAHQMPSSGHLYTC